MAVGLKLHKAMGDSMEKVVVGATEPKRTHLVSVLELVEERPVVVPVCVCCWCYCYLWMLLRGLTLRGYANRSR